MAARFTVLASGSSGNASLLQCDGFGLLLDFGLGPRVLAGRLAKRRLAWPDVHAVLLTHTHSDHWNDATLTRLLRLRIPLYCHPSHAEALTRQSEVFPALHSAGLVRLYEAGRLLPLRPAFQALPLPVSHDASETFGVRFEGGHGLFGPGWSLGYAADLGCWDKALVDALAGVDVLALEFNHDEQMQLTSGRSHALIRRVLGDTGHLSNRQAGSLLRAVLNATTRRDFIRHVITLHLSRECNRPELARAAAREALGECDVEADLHIASASDPLPTIALDGSSRRTRGPVRRDAIA